MTYTTIHFVFFKLIFKILGVEVGLGRMLFMVLIMVCYCSTGKIILPDLAYNLILVGLVVLLLRTISRISFIRAFWSTFLAMLIVGIGGLILEPFIFNKEINSFIFTSPYGVVIGSGCEMLGPLIALFILSVFKISLVPPFRKRVAFVEFLEIVLFGIIFFIFYSTFVQMFSSLKNGSINTLNKIVVLQWAGAIAAGLVFYLVLYLIQKDSENRQHAHEEERNRLMDLIRANNKEIAADIAVKLKADVPADFSGSNPRNIFKPSEYIVLKLIVQGKSNKEIGAEMGRSEDAVKRIVSGLLDKLGLVDRGQLGIYAVVNGIVKEDELLIYKKEQ